MSNLRQLHLSITPYQDDYNGLILPNQMNMIDGVQGNGTWLQTAISGGYIQKQEKLELYFPASALAGADAIPHVRCPSGPEERYRLDRLYDPWHQRSGDDLVWVSVSFNGWTGTLRNGEPGTFSGRKAPLLKSAHVKRPPSEFFYFDCGDYRVNVMSPATTWAPPNLNSPRNRRFVHGGAIPYGNVNVAFFDGHVSPRDRTAFRTPKDILPE